MTHFLLKYSNGYGECNTNVSYQLLANFLRRRLSKHRIQCLKYLPDSHRRHILRGEKWLTSRCWKFNRGVQHIHIFFFTFLGPCIVRIFQYISNKMQRYTVYFISKLLYMFRVVLPPIIRNANNRIYSICHTVTAICRYGGR